MADVRHDRSILPQFRRSLSFLRPHRTVLLIGLVSAVGVSLSYTASISAIVPVLKIIFAEHETIGDWLCRTEAQRRLGVALPADLPNDPAGLLIGRIPPQSSRAGELREGDRILAVNGSPDSGYGIARALAHASYGPVELLVRSSDGRQRTAQVSLAPPRTWWRELEGLSGRLPIGRSARDRLLTLALVMVAMVIVAVFGGICRFVNEGLIQTAVQRAMHDLRTRLGDHVLRLPLAWHTAQQPGDTLARLATDIGKVEVGQTTLFGKVVREPLKAVGVLTLAVLIEWRLLVLALLGLPLGLLLLRLFGRMVKRAQRRASESWGRLLDHLGERLAGIRVVKACNMEQAEGHRFEREGRELTRAQTHIELVDAGTNPALEVLATIAVAGFILYGGHRVFAQELEPALFFAAVICLGGVFDPVRKMGNVNNRLQAADASARRLFELLDVPTEQAAAERTNPPVLRHALEFRGVSFTYAGSPQPVLRDVAFVVPRGQTVALVGPNGSGKTTLVSLLLRFFEPSRGQILLDGRDIREFSLRGLREQIGLVTQDAVVFTGTLRENIAYGADGVAEEQVLAAARLAHVDEFARELRVEHDGRVTCGYDAWISARTLSGGQRQRIALARAVLRNPPILVLDEATSQVDSESERKIQDALDNLTRDRTTIIIAHRFSTIARADRIVVLDEGRVAGCGTHEELLRSCAVYASLCETQFAPAV